MMAYERENTFSGSRKTLPCFHITKTFIGYNKSNILFLNRYIEYTISKRMCTYSTQYKYKNLHVPEMIDKLIEIDIEFTVLSDNNRVSFFQLLWVKDVSINKKTR